MSANGDEIEIGTQVDPYSSGWREAYSTRSEEEEGISIRISIYM